MSNHPTRPTIMEVDNINPLDIRMNSRFLDPLGPILERIPDDERTDITFEHYSSESLRFHTIRHLNHYSGC
jgi:hypothetical protein